MVGALPEQDTKTSVDDLNDLLLDMKANMAKYLNTCKRSQVSPQYIKHIEQTQKMLIKHEKQ